METPPKKRIIKRYTTQEKMQHLSNWQKSGLSMSDYSRQSGVSTSALSVWNSSFKNKEITLKPVVLQNNTPLVSLNKATVSLMEVILPGGIILKLPYPDGLTHVHSLLKEIE
jgi:hypothetical protein